MMQRSLRLSAVSLAALAVLATATYRSLPAVHAQNSVFSQMDAAAAHFRSAQADVKYDVYTKVVKAHDLSSGSIYIERAGTAQSMGAVVHSEDSSSSDKLLSLSGGTLQVYTPGTNQDDVFKIGANQAKYESFLTLGFGGSGKDLQSQWTVIDQGSETVEGVKTEKLDLVGRDAGVKNLFSHVTIWLDPARDVSIKQVFYQPNGDSRTTMYSNIRLNDKIDKSRYVIPKSAKKIIH